MNKIFSPLNPGDKGANVTDLQDALQVCMDRGALLASSPGSRTEFTNALKPERAAQNYGPMTVKLVATFQGEQHLPASGSVDQPTADSLNKLLQSLGAFDPSYQVTGRVAHRSSAGVGGLRVVIVDKGIGGDVQLAQATTADSGAYQATYAIEPVRQRGKTAPDLQARVFAGDTFLGASEVHYSASTSETLNVVLPDSAAASLPSEFETLTASLASKAPGKLSALTADDITYLANTSGLDGRLLAARIKAETASASTNPAGGPAPAVAPEFFYALYLANLTADDSALYDTDAATLERVWTQAAAQGVIPQASKDKIPGMIKQFQAISAQKLLQSPPAIGVSLLSGMLSFSHLDAGKQATFAQLYVANRDDLPAFWKAVGTALGSPVAAQLQVDGKVGALTLNNARLMEKLYAAAGPKGITDPLQLVQLGYYRPEAWQPLFTADVPVPKEIPGDTPDAQRANYIQNLAANVRVSYRTAVVAEMVKSKAFPLASQASGLPDQVYAFLAQHQADFDISQQPVRQYRAENHLAVTEGVVAEVERLQRVYQVTPGDEAMAGLLRHGIDSAAKVAGFDRDTFIQGFAADLGGADSAALTYAKATQIYSAILHLSLNYGIAQGAAEVGVHSPPSIINPAPENAGDIQAMASLGTLFGSMDFCTCEHCRSILSPAAYLVDLLMFLKSDADKWKEDLSVWKQQHQSAPYPFADPNAFNQFQQDWAAQHPGSPVPDTEIAPVDVLLSRRPDIAQLPLTCENTNTALPYIDVVNETLEYFAANSVHQLSLEGYAGHDTGETASEDLLASPQYVMDAAYTTLQGERFPLRLPFNRALEATRRYFKAFGAPDGSAAPLALVMELLHKNNALERGADPYGWRDIWMEQAGLSREEYEIFTDSNAVPLWRMYGYPSGTADGAVIATLSNVRSFTRALGIGYDDLVALLKTRFVNPASDLIPKLDRLGVSFAALAELHSNPAGIQDADFNALLPAGASAIDVREYGGDPSAWEASGRNTAAVIRAWLNANDTYARVMSLITLAVPLAPWAAAKTFAAGDCVLPVKPQAGATIFFECTTAGKSGSAEPTWPDLPGDTVVDGTVTWKARDAAACLSFDNMAFRYTDPAKVSQNIGAPDFIRLMRLARLWRKTGWTVEQADAAICALYRADLAPLGAGDVDTPAEMDAGFQTLLPRLGILMRVMDLLDLRPDRDLAALLALWSPVGTHGASALYRQLFLNPAVLQQDPVFADNGYGEFLSDASQKLAAHAEAVRSACSLTGDEYAAITAYLGFDANTPLNLATLSAVFRAGWLARRLRLSVSELLLFIQLTGLDPFAAPDPTGPAILQLIALVQALKTRSLKSAAALYLVWNQDLSGKSAPDPAQVRELARTLRGDFFAIDDQFAVVEDPGGDIARARVALVDGQAASDAFFTLLDDTLVIDTPYTHPAETLEAAITAADPAIRYDPFRHRLGHVGLLTSAVENALTSVSGASQDFKNAVAALFAQSEDARGAFLARNPDLQPAYSQVQALDSTLVLVVDYTQPSAALDPAITTADSRVQYDAGQHKLSYHGLLTAARRDILKSIPGVSSEFQAAVDALFTQSGQARGRTVLAALQPGLAQRRKRQQAAQRISAAAGVSLGFVQALLDPPNQPFPLHAVDANQPGLEDVLGVATSGLAAQFFFRSTATGNIDKNSAAEADLEYAPGGDNPLPGAGSAVSGIWSGQVEAPEAGFYNLVIEADSTAAVTLSFAGAACPLTRNGSTWRNTNPIQLQAGALYPIQLKVENTQNQLIVQWETPTHPRQVIPARYLYPPTTLGPFSNLYLRFLKAASLSQALKLSPDEIAWFANHPDYHINSLGKLAPAGQGWLNLLPVADNLHQANPANEVIARSLDASLLTPLLALLDFARIKTDIAPEDESLLSVIQRPAENSQNAQGMLYTLTGWSPAALNDLLARFGDNIAGLQHFDLFRRVYDAYALVKQLGISTQALLQAATNAPAPGQVGAFQAALRARYDSAGWRQVVQPVNDAMRSLQRDALVDYILQQMRSHPETAQIDTPERLFEYFLMDVQMDPCMQTSRIRHALSTVQLFIERSLMNLEPRVAPAALNAGQWDNMMKRYRLWEANRKVYLYPENWLDPELRDDKSSFYKEFESDLLQSDITEDSATTALLNYLARLEEVAKLEPCGIFYEEPGDGQRETVHLVACTPNAPIKYFYRCTDAYGFWKPWEQIRLDIEGRPVIPVVWNHRKLLFWLRLLKQVPDDVQNPFGAEGQLSGMSTSDIKKTPMQVTYKAVLCWSEYYNGKWQPARTSNVNQATMLDSRFLPNPFDRKALRLGVRFEGEALRIYVQDPPPVTRPPATEGVMPLITGITPGNWPGSFLFYNTHSQPIPGEETVPPFRLPVRSNRIFIGDTDHDLAFEYHNLFGADKNRDILTTPAPFEWISPKQDLRDPWDAPVVFADRQHAFFIRTAEEPIWVRDYPDYGILVHPGTLQAMQIPPLVVQLPPLPKVPEDAFIHDRLETSATIPFGDGQIGPAGQISNGHVQQ